MVPEKRFLSIKSVAEFFDVSPSTATKWVELGVLPRPVVIGGLKRWDVEDLLKAAGRALDGQAGPATTATDWRAVTEAIAAKIEADAAEGHHARRRRERAELSDRIAARADARAAKAPKPPKP